MSITCFPYVFIGGINIYTNTFVPTDYSLGYTVASSIPSGTTVGDQHVKYEVVYAQVLEENSNELLIHQIDAAEIYI